jgi:Flp pilus assembly protein TadG
MNQGGHTVKTQNQKMGQKGVAAIEFAIILPFLVLLVFGSIEFGVMFYNKQVLTNATREGARAGITGIANAEVKQIVEDYCNAKLLNLNGSNVLPIDKIVVTPDGTEDLSVAVSFDYNLLFSQIIGFTDITLSARTIMRMEPGTGS